MTVFLVGVVVGAVFAYADAVSIHERGVIARHPYAALAVLTVAAAVAMWIYGRL